MRQSDVRALNPRQRTLFIERNLMLPVKWALVLISLFFVWLINPVYVTGTPEGEMIWRFYHILAYYLSTNIAFTFLFLKRKVDPLRWVRVHAYFSLIADALLVSALVYFTGGMGSELYLIYCMLFIRSAANFPFLWLQIVTDVLFFGFYALGIFLEGESFAFFADRVFLIRCVLLGGVALCSGAMAGLLRRQQEELGRTLDELQRTQRQLVRSGRLAVLGQLAAGIAHELKNPLGVIANSVYYVKRHRGRGDREVGKHLGMLEEEVKKSDKIIMDLLDDSRWGRRDFAYGDVHEILEEALKEMDGKGIGNGIVVKRRFAGELPRVLLDARRMKQAFINIMMNGCEAMPDSGELVVETKRITAEEGVTKEWVEVSIGDTGAGIPKERLGQIFDPFFSGKENGSGLGLFTVFNIVQSHGGSVGAESEPGRGTTVRVRIPA